LPALGQGTPAPPPTYRVARVVDGDTVVLTMEGRAVTVRLVGVDTPETVHPSKPVERFGKEASAFTRKLLAGKSVSIERDPGGSARDRYGRELAYLRLDGTDVNREIIARGYGFAYTKYPFARREDYRTPEREAREAKRGLWADEAAAREQVEVKPKPPAEAGICGAITKAGTPCKRKVKGGGRCYQHAG
jgi:micrococcal nuclease